MTAVHYEFDPVSSIATITFDRPEVLNALDVATAKAVHHSVRLIEGNEDIRCIVLRGKGRAFMAGGDVASFSGDFDKTANTVDQILDELHPAIIALQEHPAPVLGSVQGAVAGAGLSLMAGCDLVIAAEGTRFVLAYNQIGATPDCGGTWFLPRLVGPRRAAELMYLGAQWNETQALRYGLINRVVRPEKLIDETIDWAGKIASGPSLAHAAYKQLAARSSETALVEQLEVEREAFKVVARTSDFREGVTAFLEKRSPEFSGT